MERQPRQRSGTDIYHAIKENRPVTAYYDRQTNTPLLSSSSYPTTTHDFGFSMRFSLTR